VSPRIGLVGARRERQGLGPFVARDLLACGAEVPCVLGTTPASAASARRQLAESLGLEVRAYTRLEELLETETLDALAILSPSETHETYLRAAADAGLHALCEKPLLWGGSALAERAVERCAAFAGRGLLLAENCQWPYALDAFRELHGETKTPPEDFAMRLSPISLGEQVLGDCLPHPLSVLQALAPGDDARLEDIDFHRARKPQTLTVRFTFHAGPARIDSTVELVRVLESPRPASLTIDGRHAEREIHMPDYAMALRDDERSVPLADPLTARLREFVAELRETAAGQRAPDPAPLIRRMALLAALLDAYRTQVDDGAP